MPNITLLPTITQSTDVTTFVVVDNRLTRRITYANLKTQLATDLLNYGFKGEKGDTGDNGADGSDGVGIPPGGIALQVLAKVDTADYNTSWRTLATVAATNNYNSLSNRPTAYTATSIDSFIDVDTASTPPTNGQALVWSASSSTWKPASVGAGIGLSSRSQVVATTALTVPVGNTENCQVVGYKSYLLSKVSTNYPAWVRIYSDSSSRTNDASRSEGTDPLPGSGVIAEVITSSGSLTQLITPGVLGFNNDGITTSTIYLSITNKDVSSRIITATLNLLQLEA
jgi:hypothetical protein